MAISDTVALAADLQTYFADKLLIIAKKDQVFRQFALIQPLPSASSLTISFTQYSKLPTVAGTLTQGTPPTSNTLSNSAITATVDQVGAYVILTDLAELTVKHPVVAQVMELLGAQAGESIDLRIQAVVVVGTQVQYANGKASRTALAAGDVMTMTEFRRAAKTMRTNGALPFGMDFVLVVDPSVEADILADTQFTSVGNFTPEAVYKGEVGLWFGIRVVRSNNVASIASTTTVHTSFLFGQNAYAVTDLQALKMYVQGPGSVADPLEQQRTMGWKVSFKAVILNNNFMLRIESASNYN